MADWTVPGEGYKFAKTDEWVKVEGDEALIGITDYAQDMLSDLVFVELPAEGDSFSAGDTFGVVESVKAASDVNMPVGGEVVAVNEALEDAPETINESPFEDGWIVRVKLSDASDLDGLMDAAAYQTYCEERE